MGSIGVEIIGHVLWFLPIDGIAHTMSIVLIVLGISPANLAGYLCSASLH
jgi:hypothetical protein